MVVKQSQFQCHPLDQWMGAAAEVSFYIVFSQSTEAGVENCLSFCIGFSEPHYFVYMNRLNSNFPDRFLSLPYSLPLFDTEQLHPHRNHLAAKSAHLRQVIRLMNAQFVWVREQHCRMCLLNLHKNGFTLPMGVWIASECRPKHMSSFATALLVGYHKNWSLSVRSVYSSRVIATGPFSRRGRAWNWVEITENSEHSLWLTMCFF